MSTRIETMTIRDLNAAVVARSDTTRSRTEKCLMAQFAARITGKRVLGSISNAARIEGDTNEDYNFRVTGAEHLVEYFDGNQDAKVRAELPLTWKFHTIHGPTEQRRLHLEAWSLKKGHKLTAKAFHAMFLYAWNTKTFGQSAIPIQDCSYVNGSRCYQRSRTSPRHRRNTNHSSFRVSG